jgi:hypothetical protein
MWGLVLESTARLLSHTHLFIALHSLVRDCERMAVADEIKHNSKSVLSVRVFEKLFSSR